MKKVLICLCVTILIILCGCTAVHNDIETVDMSFKSFSGESNSDILDFINNPQVNNLYPDVTTIFRFLKNGDEVSLKSISVDGGPFEEVANSEKFNSGEYCSKAVYFLCNEDAIKKAFYENGIENIKNIVIINLDTMEDAVGYVIAAVTDNDAYYATVPLAREEYGGYIFGKVYTSEEFQALYTPKTAKVFINEKEASFSNSPLLGNMVIEMDVFEFIKALGYEYIYDNVLNKVSFGNFAIQFKKFDDSELYYALLTSTENEEGFNFPCYMKYENGRYIGDYYFYITLCHELDYKIKLNYDNYSINITTK